MLQFLFWFACVSVPLIVLAKISEIADKRDGPLAKAVSKVCLWVIMAIFAGVFLLMIWWVITGKVSPSVANDYYRR